MSEVKLDSFEDIRLKDGQIILKVIKKITGCDIEIHESSSINC